MDAWKIFEKNLVTHSRLQGIDVFKFPEDVKVLGKLVIRKKTSFDFVASVGGISMFFDAKVEAANNLFNFKSRIFNDEKQHQWTALKSLKDKDIISGYMIWFKGVGLIAWASVGVIESLVARDIKSINANDTEKYPGVVWQRDDQPINLKFLMMDDIRRWIMLKPYTHSLEKIL